MFLSLLTHSVLAQLTQAFRFEQEIKSSEEGFTVISLKKEGLALIRDTNQHSQGNKKWQLEIVDTTLAKVWSTELDIQNRLVLLGYEYNQNYLYLLFREDAGQRNKLKLFTISLSDKSIETDEIKFEVDVKISHFTMSGSSAVFGGYINNEPVVLLYDRTSNQPKVLPGLFVRDMSLLDVRANQNESFNILLVEQVGKEKRTLIVRTFDHNGNLLMDDLIEIDPKFSVLSGLTSTLERDELIIVGTYAEGLSREALGFFSVVVDPFHEQSVSYTDFSSLEHFLDYLPPRRAEKIKLKASKQRALGLLPNYTTHIVPFRIEERPDGFYLLAEVYEPSHVSSTSYPYSNSLYTPGYYSPYSMGPYSNSSPYSNRYYNSPYANSNSSNHSSVQMIETVVVKLGANGKTVKGASMKLNNIRQSELEQVGDFTISKDSIFIMYKKDADIFYQHEIGDQDEKVELNQLKVKLQGKNDALQHENENEGTIRFWYDRHFYVWGYQTIKDATREVDQTRKVFYVNRISVE